MLPKVISVVTHDYAKGQNFHHQSFIVTTTWTRMYWPMGPMMKVPF